MLQWFRNIFARESIEDIPAAVTTSQQAVDTESRNWLMRSLGVYPPYDLNEYLSLYLTDSLAYSICHAVAMLVVSEIEVKADSDDLSEYVSDFCARINLQSSIERLTIDANIYGLGLAEIVGDGPTLRTSRRILGLTRLDPRYVVIEKDKQGRFVYFHQRPGVTAGGTTASVAWDTPIDPESVIYVCNWSPYTCYGHSLLQSVKSRLSQRQDLLSAAVKAAVNHSNPCVHWHYSDDPDRPENREEIKRQRDQLKTAVEKVEAGETRNVVSAGRGQYSATPVGHTTVPDSKPLIEFLTADILTAVGLSPASLGYAFGSGVTSHDASGRMTTNAIIVEQQTIMSQVAKLCRLLPLIETDCPDGDVTVSLAPPTEESAKEKAEAIAVLLNNVDRQWRMGVLTRDQGARELGRDAVADPERWEQYMSAPAPTDNPKDPNSVQQTTAALRTLNNGTRPSNNPAGGRGNSNYENYLFSLAASGSAAT